MASIAARPSAARRRPWYAVLYIQVLIAIVIGVLVGALFPDLGKSLRPLGDAFVALIKMMIAPMVFCTVVHGIASMSDLAKIGRVGLKALIYFEVISTAALVVGLIVGELLHPGIGFNMDLGGDSAKAVAGFIEKAKSESVVQHLLAIIPGSYLDALARGDLLQVLFIAVLTGFAITKLGPIGTRITAAIDMAGQVFFRIIGMIVYVAPIGAFGAMAFTIGAFGFSAIPRLAALVATFYITSILFVLVVLGAVARLNGFSILRFIAYVKDEILIVVGTGSSETVLPNLMRKIEGLGASKSVVGLVVPTGYSFNLDGTNIYMTLAMLFLAQATNAHLTFGQELTILAIAMLTSKGAAAITGGGFIVLAATLQSVPEIPITSLAVLLGIDKFMAECRALINLVGNGVAGVVISRWEGEIDRETIAAMLSGTARPRPLLEAERA